jgi:peptide deformylase
MIKEAIQLGDPRLKAFNKTIENFKDPIVRQVVENLNDSMKFGEHIGMAAPQIGENLRIFVTELRETKWRTKAEVDEPRIFINPKIIKLSKEKSLIWEGCGSVVNSKLFGPVKRPKEITIEAQDLNGKCFRLACDGILARVIQHEYDHLDGIQFVERMIDLSQLKNAEFYMRDIKGLPELSKAMVITKKVVEIM